jgi:hypothetical protein
LERQVKTIQKATKAPSGLRLLVEQVRNRTWMALKLEQQSDADKVGREIKTLIGNDLKPVTVLLMK